MPLKRYGVLRGKITNFRPGSGQNPHYQMLVVDDKDEHRVAVNVQSQDGSEVQYFLKSHFEHPLRDDLMELPLGLHTLESKPGGLALDYIRGNIAQPDEFIPLPINLSGPDNDLNEKIGQYVQRAMADEASNVYAFGQIWGPEAARDKIFGFQPGSGIHDIHMNQGNDAGHRGDDGVWQDGGLLLQFPSQNQWVAVFLRFQSQAWHTDDSNGHTLPVSPGGPPVSPRPDPPGPGTLPTPDQPDGMVQIVAAVVNDTHSPERETVTLLNTSPREISLNGWMLVDKQKNKMPLNGKLAAGATQTVVVRAPVALSNKGGIITVIDDRGVKVDGVAYTKAQVKYPGWTITF